MRRIVSPRPLSDAGADLRKVEEGIDKLRALFPDTTLLAALDLVDRESGMCLVRHRTRSPLTSSCSAQVPLVVGSMLLPSPWIRRDIQCLPQSGLVAAHVLLLYLPCVRVCGPDERVPSHGRPATCFAPRMAQCCC